MDLTILLFLLQDGITSGAIYALLGVALVLVFAVTRVIFIPQGEFVAYGALTFAVLESGLVPGTVWLLVGAGFVALLFELWAQRSELTAALLFRQVLLKLAIPAIVAAVTFAAIRMKAGSLANIALTVAIIAPLGPYLYRIAFQPNADASVLTLLISAVGVHLAMMGLGLILFGAEGLRAPPLSNASFSLGPVPVSGQSIGVYLITIGLIAALWLFFDRTLMGKALRATAVNRIGARLVGIRTSLSGRIAFALAAAIGAVSGILIVPVTTIYYDTGFIIGLKGFVAAIIGGLASYPLTAAAAILVGIVEALASFFASDLKEIIVFMLIIPVLIWRSVASGHHDEEDE